MGAKLIEGGGLIKKIELPDRDLSERGLKREGGGA